MFQWWKLSHFCFSNFCFEVAYFPYFLWKRSRFVGPPDVGMVGRLSSVLWNEDFRSKWVLDKSAGYKFFLQPPADSSCRPCTASCRFPQYDGHQHLGVTSRFSRTILRKKQNTELYSQATTMTRQSLSGSWVSHDQKPTRTQWVQVRWRNPKIFRLKDVFPPPSSLWHRGGFSKRSLFHKTWNSFDESSYGAQQIALVCLPWEIQSLVAKHGLSLTRRLSLASSVSNSMQQKIIKTSINLSRVLTRQTKSSVVGFCLFFLDESFSATRGFWGFHMPPTNRVFAWLWREKESQGSRQCLKSQH